MRSKAMTRRAAVALGCGLAGAPMAVGQGPYRLVVEGDKRPARSARMVSTITLRRAQ